MSEIKITDFWDFKRKNYSFINFASIGFLLNGRYKCKEFIYMCDGLLMSMFVSMVKFKLVERKSFDFTSLAVEVFDYAMVNSCRIFFIGGSEDEVVVFEDKISRQYPGLICGFHTGYLASKSKEELLNEISSGWDILVVGMGAGKQEEFILDARESGFDGVAFTCGGFISQTAMAKDVDYYPYLINKLNLRFVYRMVKEPHTVRRYLLDYPHNICKTLVGLVFSKVSIKLESR